VATVRTPGVGKYTDDGCEVERAMQVRPGEPARPFRIETQFGVETARVDRDHEQVVGFGEQQVGDHHRLLRPAEVDESLLSQRGRPEYAATRARSPRGLTGKMDEQCHVGKLTAGHAARPGCVVSGEPDLDVDRERAP